MAYDIKVIVPGNRYLFACACDGLVRSVRVAADPSNKEWYPQYGYVVTRAYWDARAVHRQAVKLGLIPSTAQLEAEARRVA